MPTFTTKLETSRRGTWLVVYNAAKAPVYRAKTYNEVQQYIRLAQMRWIIA